MKNWHTLEPDVVKLVGPHRYTAGRGGHKISEVVIHHNAGINTVEQVWALWEHSRAASAHYQVESNGRIGQLVWDRDTAYHAANWLANQRSIGIEVSNSGGEAQGWPISDTAVEETAHLVAAICRFYNLGRPVSGKNVKYHRDYAATSCPYQLAPGGRRHNQLIQRAQYWYDQMGAEPEESFLSALTPDEQRELLDNSRVIRRELTQLYPSRSAYRTDDKPVDTLAGMTLNADARIHELWIEHQAKKHKMTPEQYAAKINGGTQ